MNQNANLFDLPCVIAQTNEIKKENERRQKWRQRVDWSLSTFSRRHVVCVPEEMPVDLASEESEKVAELPYIHSVGRLFRT